MTPETATDEHGALRWSPGIGGLIARVAREWLPALDASELPPDAIALRDDGFHVTLLRRRSMLALVDTLGPRWTSLAPGLPRPPRPRFRAHLRCARRPLDALEDLPPETRPRLTWFLAVENQDEWRLALARIVEALDARARSGGGLGFAHPEPDRFFHVSLYNNRGGDPARSIGDISPLDWIRQLG